LGDAADLISNAKSFPSTDTAVGGALPQVIFRIGGVDTVLRPAHALLKQFGPKGTVGNFGLDLLKQGCAFRIDLAAMTLELER